MILTLHRIYLNEATLGVLEIGASRLFVCEDLPGDGPNHCVPEGHYILEPHSGPKWQDTWALVGPGVSHMPRPGNRSAILFHSGNTTGDSEGCILVGMDASPAGVVFQSRMALGELRKLLVIGATGHELIVQRG